MTFAAPFPMKSSKQLKVWPGIYGGVAGIVCELVLMENWRPLQSGTALEVQLHNFPSGNGSMGLE